MMAALLLSGAVWVWPVPGALVTPFQPPAHDFGAGHRGIDIGAEPGTPVRAAHGGTVSFAGTVAGIGTVTVRNGRMLTTYQPVLPGVDVAASVTAGDVLGSVARPHTGCACLHLGVRVDGAYRDPLLFFRSTTVLKSPRAP